MKVKKQLLISSLVYITFCLIILTSNYLMNIAETNKDEKFEMFSGMLFGFIGVPIFSIILPLYFANKWKLNYSLWPKSKKAWQVIVFVIAYIIITNYSSLKIVLQSNYSASDFFVHYISTLLFHVTYYPLFVVLIFPVIRSNYGLWPGILLTSMLFAFYHMTQYHFFPAGTTLQMQIMLFIAFGFNILIYLWSESIILVSLLHSTNGAIGLLSNGMISNQVDFVFFLTIVIVLSLFFYYIIREMIQRKNKEFSDNWWINLNIESK